MGRPRRASTIGFREPASMYRVPAALHRCMSVMYCAIVARHCSRRSRKQGCAPEGKLLGLVGGPCGVALVPCDLIRFL